MNIIHAAVDERRTKNKMVALENPSTPCSLLSRWYIYRLKYFLPSWKFRKENFLPSCPVQSPQSGWQNTTSPVTNGRSNMTPCLEFFHKFEGKLLEFKKLHYPKFLYNKGSDDVFSVVTVRLVRRRFPLAGRRRAASRQTGKVQHQHLQ